MGMSRWADDIRYYLWQNQTLMPPRMEQLPPGTLATAQDRLRLDNREAARRAGTNVANWRRWKKDDRVAPHRLEQVAAGLEIVIKRPPPMVVNLDNATPDLRGLLEQLVAVAGRLLDDLPPAVAQDSRDTEAQR